MSARAGAHARLCEEMPEDVRLNPLEHVRVTDPQLAYLRATDQRLVWRGGNTIGKSYGAALDIVHAARGTHPWRPVPKPPVRLLVISESWAQMDPLCEKIWGFLPKGEIDPRVGYAPGEGFTGFRIPHIPFVRGVGAGTAIMFATYGQGGKRIAGGQYHGIWGDEPMPEPVLGEVLPRTSRYHASIRITVTPTPEAPPQLYLRDKVKESLDYRLKHGRPMPGGWSELQTSITLDALTPRGGLIERPWKSAAELEELLESYLEVERGMREHGDWDPVLAGRWLTAFDEHHIVTEGPTEEDGELVIAVGIDHGAKAGRQSATLVVCSEDGERVWYLDEAVSDGRTSSQEDAQAILDMLERQGWGWEQVDHWVGDRAHSGDRFGNAKSNYDLLHEMSLILKKPVHVLRGKGLSIATPTKKRNSVYRGVRIMNSLFKQNQSWVHLRCQGLLEAIKGWAGASDDPLKDRVDSARYAVETLQDSRRLRMRVPSAARIE